MGPRQRGLLESGQRPTDEPDLPRAFSWIHRVAMVQSTGVRHLMSSLACLFSQQGTLLASLQHQFPTRPLGACSLLFS